ncbi:hypothetical protein NIES4073_41390 [Kalymmatonema gypsitolerans NIES-4073]|nr:hypothetical protein NIES4073_41390 [Scytonema sp. NIES-4073]
MMENLQPALEKTDRKQLSTRVQSLSTVTASPTKIQEDEPDICLSVRPRIISIKRCFPVWQITLPLCMVMIFGIGALTAFYMVEGRYLFDLDISRERIKIRTEVDKRESNPEQDTTKPAETKNQLVEVKGGKRQHYSP